MAHRRNKQSKHKLPPKTRDIELSINIWGDRFQSEGERGRRHQLKDFKGLLEAAGFQVAKAQEPVNSPAGNARIINIVLKTTESRKSKFFERFRREWCSSICQRGDSFWMESETPKDTFKYKTDETRQMIGVASFSFGTFTTLGTYVQHWSSEQDSASIQEGSIESEFQHDLGTFTIFIFKEGAIEGSKEIKFEMEHRQFENYVVVDENVVSRKISFYFPLKWPPKIFEEVTINDHTNYDRLTHFLGCSREILGSSSVLCLNFPLKERILERDEADSPLGLMTGLSRRGFSLCFANIKTNFPRGITEVPRKPTLSDPKIMYALECLLSRGFKVRDRISRKFYDLLRNATDRYGSLQENNLVSPEKVCKALYRLVSIVETDRFCPLVHYLEKLLYGDMMHLTAFEFEIPKHYAYVPRLIVTPTQDYLLPAELVAENRVIREYGHERAMRIAFREEDFSKLSSTHPEGLKHVLKERVVELLSKDVHIAGRKFEFLACSNSQLRDHGAWLYDTEGEHRAADIRGSLGQLNEIRCVATYVSRMGQCFSSTKEAVTVSIEVGCKVEKIPDVEVEYNNVYFECCRNLRSGKYTFSDGVGKISRALAEKVADSLSLEPTPSAYQIRYGGCKGMLAIDPRLPNGDNQEILQYRKSMEKFNSKHSALEICEATKPNLLYLNRQCIILLNGLGVPDESFISLQDKMLRSLALMLLFETVALETLQRANIPGGLKITALSRSGLNVTREPFFRSLLLAIYKSRLGDLLRRARIAIPETHGRLLMGVIDETGSLEYGQVFVRYSKLVSQPGKQLEILKGKVVISKNPCFHPGDMRIFEAVDIPALHHLVDCLVFPAKGHRPHSDEMSGSDLDGDKYFVTWYEKLLPRKDNVAPMDFTSPEKMELQRPIEVSDMIQFVAEYIKNDQLGIIANAHLVHADHDEEGVFSDACIRLAHMHSDAVDFPKTGKCPSLPKELRPDQYPDFMMKSGKPRYNSQRILGKLFRKCKSLDRAQQFSAEASQSQIIPDPDLIVQGYEHYLEEAEAVKIHYNTKLDGLMSLYGLRNEGEVITGCLVKVNTRLAGKTDEKFEVAQMIQASLSTLRAKTRHDFYDEFGGEDEVMEEFEENGHFAEEILQKASAWYMTTYGDRGEGEVQRTASSTDPNQQREKGDRKRLLSFPWVVDRILANIKKGKKQERERDGTQAQHAMGAVGDLITDQAAYFFDKLKSELLDIRKVQIEERDKLKDTLNLLFGEARAPRLALFDSSLTGISVGDEQQTSVGIYIHVKWNASEKEQYEYLQWLGRALSREGEVKMQRHPLVLHFQRGSSQGLKLLRQDFYITADSNRFQKSAYVSMQVQRCPRLLHLLLILIHWGRRRRIIGNSRNSFLSDENLATIFLVFCEESDFINKLSSADMQNFSSRHLGLPSSVEQTEAERVWSNEVLGEDYQERLKGLKGDKTPGHLLIKFFEHYSLVADDDPLHIRIMTNPVKSLETLCPNVSTEESNRFSDAALHAFHELAQCCGLDSFTASSHTESTRELKETLSMPNTTWGALRFAEEFVRVKLSTLTSAQISLRPAQNGYILEATGNYLTLHAVQNELEKIETTCRSYIYDHTVSGASRFLFLDQNGPNDMVNFKQLQRGDYAVNLDPLNGLLRHGLGLDDGPNSDLVEQKFLSLISSQVGVFKQEYLPYVHGADRLMIRVEFGSIYVQNARFDAPTVGAVEDMLSQNADSTNRPGSSQAQKRKLMTHKFIPVLDCGESWTAAFPTILHDSFAETYTLGIKEGRNHTKTVRYDSELQFCDVDIPPINWVVADVKAPRHARAKSRDIDFRVTVCSQRKLEDDKDEVMSSPGYEMFSTKSILSKPGNMSLDLELASGFQTKVSYVRHDKTSIYKISDGNLFLQVKEVMKYEGKGSRFLKPSKNSTEVQIFGFFDGKGDLEEAMKVSRNLWSAAKRLRPHIR